MTAPTTVDLRIRFGPEKHRRNIEAAMTRGQFAAVFATLICLLVVTSLLLAVLFVNVYLASK